MFKGLQKPLEFMGLQGRYIYWAAATVGSALLGFMLFYAVVGFIAGLVFAVVAFIAGAYMILTRQRKGLHTKRTTLGLTVYSRLKQI